MTAKTEQKSCTALFQLWSLQRSLTDSALRVLKHMIKSKSLCKIHVAYQRSEGCANTFRCKTFTYVTAKVFSEHSQK